jgi:hypothetical protein
MNYKNAGQDAEIDNDVFRRVSLFALTNTSVNVMKEVNTTPGHVERVAFAKKVLSGEVPMGPVMYVLLTDPTLLALNRTSAATDAQIQSAVDNLFNILAGIST